MIFVKNSVRANWWHVGGRRDTCEAETKEPEATKNSKDHEAAQRKTSACKARGIKDKDSQLFFSSLCFFFAFSVSGFSS